jgi:GT2 family glycosyltransferase
VKANEWRRNRGRLPKPAEIPILVRKAIYQWKQNEVREVLGGMEGPSGFELPKKLNDYDAWLEVNQWNTKREQMLLERLLGIVDKPLLSIIMPVYNPPLVYLEKAIDSVRNQIYENWELCIADDASTNPDVKKMLEYYSGIDSRIKISYRKKNGNISEATNSAVELASGDFLVLMDNDDEITIDALAEISLYLVKHPETDILYSDDDKINENGDRFAPQFKPDWSPELLLSYMYFSHILVVSRELYWCVGGMRLGFEGSQDYDLVLRATEKARHIGHISKILYHWRVLPGSTASSGHEKPKSFEAGRKAIQEALDRRGIEGEVYQPEWALQAGVGIYSHKFSDAGPSVAIIIPTKNQVKILKKCIDSIVRNTSYKNYKIYIIDNESDEQETLDYFKTLSHKVLRIPNPNGTFNYAAINNEAAKRVDSEYILFLNNDTEVINATWLSNMVGYMQFSQVGAVGAKLIFPDGRLQHAGIVQGYYKGMVGPAFKLLPSWNNGYLSYAAVTRNYMAVTAACLLTPKRLFLEQGGFDEVNFAVAYNDVDYCYRLVDSGYRIVYSPDSQLNHYEGYTRGFVDNPSETANFKRKYHHIIDPYYNPNLSLENERFELSSRTLLPSVSIKPVKTLVCTFSLDWTGAALHQYEIVCKLKQQGTLDPVVYCHKDGPLRSDYEKLNIKVYIIEHPLSHLTGVNSYVEAIQKFGRKLEEWKVELVYANTYQSFFAVAAAHAMNIPSVWNIHESEPWQTYFNYFGNDIATRALGCMEYPYKVIFVSDATRRNCELLCNHNNFVTIHNGIDRSKLRSLKIPKHRAREMLGVGQDKVVILLLGTICERKGQIDLLQALQKLSSDALSNISCYLVGDRSNEYSDNLHELYNNSSDEVRNVVRIIPETPETIPYLSAADLFVCTSRIESFPRVTLEAMSFDLPIITTPVFGLTEQVQEGVNGLFYSPGDVNSLAEAILKLIENKDMRMKFSKNSEKVLDILTDFNTMVELYGEAFVEAWLANGTRHRI